MKEIVIVTGGSSGLGLELCKQLAGRDFLVFNLDRNNSNEKAFKTFIGDVSDETFITKTINVIAEHGKIKTIINNAGVGIFKLPKENSKKILDELYKGVFGMILLTTKILPHLEANGGKVINIMSSASLRGNAEESAYCSMKWAERGYTESLKANYKGSNVLIMGVYPGGIDTPFYENARDYVSYEKQKTFMSAKDVAHIIIANAFASEKLNVADLMIERI